MGFPGPARQVPRTEHTSTLGSLLVKSASTFSSAMVEGWYADAGDANVKTSIDVC